MVHHAISSGELADSDCREKITYNWQEILVQNSGPKKSMTRTAPQHNLHAGNPSRIGPSPGNDRNEPRAVRTFSPCTRLE